MTQAWVIFCSVDENVNIACKTQLALVDEVLLWELIPHYHFSGSIQHKFPATDVSIFI